MENSGRGLSNFPEVNQLLGKVVDDFRHFAEDQVAHIQELVKIGVALSAEKDTSRLLEMIINEAKRFTNADGGTLYIRDPEKDVLEFAIVCNDTLGLRMGGSGREISWPEVPLRDAEGRDNYRNVSAYSALSGRPVAIADVYRAEGFDFSGTKEFDQRTGYRSRSMLVIPMRDHEDQVIGVLQLLNAKARETGEVIEFSETQGEIVTSLASQAAIALTNSRLIRGLEELFNAFIKSIADAIDEKSPYTGGHILRVAELTERIAEEVNAVQEGPLAGYHFSPDELYELRIAAWMHDVGKITTPEHVVNKATKLETIFDRIELVRLRLELLKKDQEIARLKRADPAGLEEEPPAPPISGQVGGEIGDLAEVFAFLTTVNRGTRVLQPEELERIKELAAVLVEINGRLQPLLDRNEVQNLTIRTGTLTDEERRKVNNHVNMTIKILESLPFPRKMQQVPRIAGMHHEKVDGSGYPRGLLGEEIPLQARILAAADVFEALTAADRPYKPGRRLSEAMWILKKMVEEGHLDGAVCDLMVSSGVVSEYAGKVLTWRQKDDFRWQGKTYAVGRETAGQAGGRRRIL